MRTIVYIDGFNLYYGAVKRTPYRWLDPVALSRALLPNDEVAKVKYFTARIKAVPHDPGAPARQDTYFRALNTISGLEVIRGHFLRKKKWSAIGASEIGLPSHPWGERIAAKLCEAIGDTGLLRQMPGGLPQIKVWKTEEKGSDVNLATHLLADGFSDEYELAVVVSNDSDLELPIRYVRETLGKPVGILNPHKFRNFRLAPDELGEGSFYKRIRKGPLEASQLPRELTDELGTFHRPESWSEAKKR